RPSTGEWWVSYNTYGGNSDGYPRLWGLAGDIPVPADYDGDGRTDFAYWRPSTGEWCILRSSDYSIATEQLGQWGDIPVPADYDGDGRADVAIWRPATGLWWAIKSSVPWFAASLLDRSITLQWGQVGDLPVPGDHE